MSSGHSGAVVRFATNGDSPTADSAIYTSPIPVDGTMTVKAKAFHPDYTASAETSRAYTITAAPPTISPSTGTYTSAQTVTLTPPAGAATTVRYTLDDSEPTGSSNIYVAPFTIDTGTTIKARAFPTSDGVASSVASASLNFNYGATPAPTPSPGGGVYADAQQITLSASAGATIRFTTDGTEPTSVSNLYVSPIPVATGSVAVKARAFHPDWTQSAVAAVEYTIDEVPPTISAARFPASIDGWHNTATTISFVCDDNVGIASCNSSSVASTEGAGQQVVGTATDLAGRQTTETVTVNLDFTPPVVAISSPTGALTTTDAAITLSGNVSDALSGIAGATCNGETAAVTSGAVSCAMDVSTWTPIWSDSNINLVPVASLANGRVAMHDVVAGTLNELSADGVPLVSVPFGGGYQTAFGLFTRVESDGSTTALTSRVSLPLDEELDSFYLGGGPTLQNSPPERPGRNEDQDVTAILLMDELLRVGPQYNAAGQRIEHAGHICKEPNRQSYFYLLLAEPGTANNAPGLQLSPERCKKASTVGYAHSHPGSYETSDLPSGYASRDLYYDVDLRTTAIGGCQQSWVVDTPDGCERSDLWIADYYFDAPAWAPKGPNVMWYVTAPMLPRQSYAKYKKTAAAAAKDNIRRYRHSDGEWVTVGSPW